MAKNAKKPTKVRRVSPLKPGLSGASRLVQSRVHAGMRAATLSRSSMLRFSASVLFVFFALAFIALWLGGHLSVVRDNVDAFKRNQLMAMGFTVERIDVTGEGRLNEADVRAAVGIYEGDYFFGADLRRAQSNTESLPWVDRAVVRRLWPNRIVVQLVETSPYALYQKDGLLHLTAHDGEIIAPYNPEAGDLPSDLRLFIGVDAAQHAQAITETLQRHPFVWAKTEVLTRYPSGRWDVTFKDGRILRLPLTEMDTALRRFAALETQTARRFAIVDLRLADRMTLTPSAPIDA
jgi:cell division protein FtsQ